MNVPLNPKLDTKSTDCHFLFRRLLSHGVSEGKNVQSPKKLLDIDSCVLISLHSHQTLLKACLSADVGPLVKELK